MNYILSLDSGTTSVRTILFDEELNEICRSQIEFEQIFPKAGWVEHDAEEIWEKQLQTIEEVLRNAAISVRDIASIGITNQRETIVVWNKETGKPVCNAIVWQDRRTADICASLVQNGMENYVREQTGLVIDAYFSGTKIKWILENIPMATEDAGAGKILAGTIDCWLLWKLTDGKVHATDHSNASRTMLFNIRDLQWDAKMLSVLDIPEQILPKVKNSAGKFGETTLFGDPIPICGMAGDQQAALFGQQCFSKGMAKNTYGTGCFMLMHIGDKVQISENKLLTTIAWRMDDVTHYALEGSVFIAGAAIQWLRDQLQVIQHAEETAALAASIEENNGVYFIPAFTGLGAPHWNMHVRGTITGLTRGTGKAHIVRAALESIAYQTRDVFEAMMSDTGIDLSALKVDGGASSNDWLMQFQSEQLHCKVIRPAYIESTALGAAMLAGIGAGLFTLKGLQSKQSGSKVFVPKKKKEESDIEYAGWKKAMEDLLHDRRS